MSRTGKGEEGSACPGPSGIAKGMGVRHLPVTRCKGKKLGESTGRAMRFDQAGIPPQQPASYLTLAQGFVTEHQSLSSCTLSEALTAAGTESVKRWQAVVGLQALLVADAL
jgi:hypothetical protein